MNLFLPILLLLHLKSLKTVKTLVSLLVGVSIVFMEQSTQDANFADERLTSGQFFCGCLPRSLCMAHQGGMHEVIWKPLAGYVGCDGQVRGVATVPINFRTHP